MFKRHPKAQKVSSLAEIDQLASSGKPVLVDFYQVGCAPCQVMDGIMNELAREYGDSAHIVKVDVAASGSVANALQGNRFEFLPRNGHVAIYALGHLDGADDAPRVAAIVPWPDRG